MRTHRLVQFFLTYVKSNFQIALEYRVSFWAQVLAMLLNDAMWIAFWAIFFTQFTVVRGYGFQEVATVWSIAAVSFGLTTGLFGNCWRFGSQVASGALDFYLVLPKPVLFHLIISHMEWSSWGDVLFGLIAFVTIVRPSPETFALFLLLAILATAITIAYGILANSLVFWLGTSESLASQCLNALLIYSTYPGSLFTGAVKVLLFSVVPAGFVAYIPADLLREWNWSLAGSMVAAAAASMAMATVVFYAGLRRYESGNLLAMRG